MRDGLLPVAAGACALLSLGVALGSCTGSNRDSPADEPGAIPCVSPDGSSFDPPGTYWRVERGVVYEDPGDGGTPLAGDLYLPIGVHGPLPNVLHIHGGGWVLGGRGLPMGTYFGEHLACRGFAFYDIDYRLIPRVSFPEDVQDCKCAVRWLRGNAGRYGLDPTRIAVMGGSAGGHLTAMVALAGDDPYFDRSCSEHPDETADVQAAIPFYGVHDWSRLWALDTLDLESLYLGGLEGFPADPEVLSRVSPVTYVSRAVSPFHIIQGRADIGVLWEQQAAVLDSALEEAGKSSEVTYIEGANHAFDLFPASPYTEQATRALVGFLEGRFGKQKTAARATREAAPRLAKGGIERHLALGKRYLEANMPRAAGVEYLSVVSRDGGLDPGSCEGNYGYLLSLSTEYFDWLHLLFASIAKDAGRSVMPTILGTSNAPPLPEGQPPLAYPLEPGSGRPADMDTVVSNYVEPFEDQFTKPMEEALGVILSKGCTFETEGVPIAFQGTVDPPGTMVFGRKLAGTEANLLGAAVALTQGIFDLLAAHDLSFDIGEAIQTIPERILDDPVGCFRLLGIAADHSPPFLTFHPARKQRYARVAEDFATAADRLSASVRLLFRDERAASREEASERVLGYFDASGNGRIGPGDDLWLGLLSWDEGPPEATYPVNLGQGGLGPVVEAGLWLVVDENYVNETQALLAKIARSLRGSGELVNLADLNKIFSQLLTPLPATIAVDLGALFPKDVAKAKPLREWLPAWGTYDPPGGDDTYAGAPHPILLAEGEVGREATAEDEKTEVESLGAGVGSCYVCLPGERFPSAMYGPGAPAFRLADEVASRLAAAGDPGGPDAIPDDCTDLPRVGMNIGSAPFPLVYAYFQDPTLNGALYVNLERLREPGGACDAADAAHSSTSWDARRQVYPKEDRLRASNYSLNKALGSIAVALAPLLELLP